MIERSLLTKFISKYQPLSATAGN